MLLLETYYPNSNLVVIEDLNEYVLVLEKEAHVFSFLSKKPQTLKTFKNFSNIKTGMKDTGVAVGVTAIAAYTQAKNKTAKLFAKTAYEKIFYKKIAQDLQSTGKYKIKTLNTQGGTIFELQRVKD